MATEKNLEKNEVKELQKKLFYKKENLGKTLTADELKDAEAFCGNYMAYLDSGKTEREAASAALAILKEAGFSEYQAGGKYNPGDKVYYVNRGKAVIAAVFGKDGVKDGVSILASHIDSPRVDLKQSPLYEDAELAYFKTHYYGGIKKYQWTAVPLALHGVIFKADGEKVEVNVGEDEKDPVFVITDLLPHLAEEQYKRPAGQLIKGEELNILIGSRPYKFKDEEGSDMVKLAIMNLLHEKYGITERDFLTAELEAVPAQKARDIGFDRSLIGAYGQDDRVCAFTSLMATVDFKGIPEKTVVCVLTDKEETGSDGNTGLASSYLKYFIEELADTENVPVRTVLTNSKCLSADVNAGFDPTFPDVLERRNAAFLNYGVVVTKFTGSRGKAGTSDANAEYTSEVRGIFDKNNVIWQTGELGKVDMGGGGTVALYVANLNVDTIDVGVPVLSMHAPFEVTAKADVYMTYKAFLAFIGR